ncbi:unnamed protein product [Ascophyllum nodosum]
MHVRTTVAATTRYCCFHRGQCLRRVCFFSRGKRPGNFQAPYALRHLPSLRAPPSFAKNNYGSIDVRYVSAEQMDDLFDDEECGEPPAPKEESRAEKMALIKAAKDAKKRVDRSQIIFEVKPWDTEVDLKALFDKITNVKIDGLVWGEAHKLVPVAFGVKKLVLSCVVEDDKVGVEDITDVIEGFEEEVQSVDMATMNKI